MARYVIDRVGSDTSTNSFDLAIEDIEAALDLMEGTTGFALGGARHVLDALRARVELDDDGNPIVAARENT